MPDTTKYIYLPDTMANWPWPRVINSHYEEVKAESNAWFHSLKAFSAQSQHAFDKCDFPRLASLAYPHVSKEHLRTGSDLLILLFAIDEYTDVESAPVVRNMLDIVLDAMKNPHKPCPKGEVVLGEMARHLLKFFIGFWELAIMSATATAQRHMIEAIVENFDSVVQQAADRDKKFIRSVESYIKFRRLNIGTRATFVPLELDLDLPDEVFNHPALTELHTYVTDMVLLDNDLFSYNKEQATGDDLHNIVTVAMCDFNVDMNGAMDWVLNYYRDIEPKFRASLERFPSLNPEKADQQVKRYLEGFKTWPRGHNCWCFESARYFGNRGIEIQETRRVLLLPKASAVRKDDGSHRGAGVVVPLIEALEAAV